MLSLLLTSLLAAPQDPPPQDYELAEGPHCAVLCHWRSVRLGEKLPREFVGVIEAAWRAAAGEGEDPLPGEVVVNVHPDRKAYVQVEAGVSGGAHKSDWAFALGAEVHVTMQPVLTDKVLSTTGVPPRVLRRAAREALGLALRARYAAEAGTDAAVDAWVLDALARSAAQRALVDLGRDAPGSEAPHVSQQLWLLRARRASGEFPTLAAALAPGAALTDDERGALTALLGERLFFAEDTGARARALLQAGGADVGAHLLALLGDDADAAFGAWLDALPLPFRELSGSMARTDLGWLQSSAAGESAVCFNAQPVGKQEYTLRGELLLLPGAKGSAQMNLLVGRLGDDYLSVAMNAAGGVTVFAFDADGGDDGQGVYTELSTWKGVELRVQELTTFELVLRDGRGFLTVNGREVPPFSVEGRDMSGAWGYGVQRGRIGAWFGVALVE